MVVLGDSTPVQAISQLRGTLGIIRGYFYSGVLDTIQNKNPHLQISPRNSHLSIVKSLQAKRINYALNYLLPAQVAAQKTGYTNMQHKILYQEGVYVFVSKNVENAASLLQQIETIMPTVRYQKSVWAEEQGLLQFD